MIEVSAAQLDTWVNGFMLPFARLLGLVAVAPLFANRAISVRIRMALALAVTIAVLPALPTISYLPSDSWLTLAVLAQQMLIGIGIGFVMRLIFAAVDVAGELIGLQMGLSFAIFFNPQTGGQSSVVAEFLNLVTLLLFLAFNGHLMLISVLVKSFEWLPVGGIAASQSFILIVKYATVMFFSGVLLALPMVATLLITNIALGVLTRAAPQLNLFAVGFPVTLTVGMIVLLTSLSFFAPMALRLFETGFSAIEEVLRAMTQLPIS